MSSLPPPTRNELIGYCAMQGVLQKQLLAEVVNLLSATGEYPDDIRQRYRELANQRADQQTTFMAGNPLFQGKGQSDTQEKRIEFLQGVERAKQEFLDFLDSKNLFL